MPRYSTRKERKMPAMRMAAAVDSYSSSPRHSFWNMRTAWVKSWMGVSTVALHTWIDGTNVNEGCGDDDAGAKLSQNRKDGIGRRDEGGNEDRGKNTWSC